MCHRRRIDHAEATSGFLQRQPLWKIINFIFSLARAEFNGTEIECGPDEALAKNGESFSGSDDTDAAAHYRQPPVKIDTTSERAACRSAFGSVFNLSSDFQSVQ